MSRDYQKEIEAEFLKAYDDLADTLFRHAYFKVGDREKAKDLIQETFMKIWTIFSSGEKIKNVKAYSFKILNNMIIDYYRKKKETSLEVLSEDGFDVPDDSHEVSIVEAEINVLRKAVWQLESQFREVLTMRYITGLSPKEIAEAIGETENNVSVRINRGIKKLKENLQI